MIDRLIIQSIGEVTNLEGLQNIRQAKELAIVDMNNLLSLQGMMSTAAQCSIHIGLLRIEGNNRLQNLQGLNNVATVGINPSMFTVKSSNP